MSAAPAAMLRTLVRFGSRERLEFLGRTRARAQHPDQYRPERPIYLAVDQQFGEGAALGVAPELADPLGSLEIGKHQDVEQLGAGSGTERVQALTKLSLDLFRPHGMEWTKR